MDQNWDETDNQKLCHNKIGDVSIYPMATEVSDRHTNPPLLANQVIGVYHNVDKYLEIQFKLLREDLTRDLRYGLGDYAAAKRRGNRTDHIKGVWIYQEVRIGNRFADSLLSFRAQFDVKSARSVDWQTSKRLKNGSLLCLSYDNFETFCFATVKIQERNVDNLKNGLFAFQLIEEWMEGYIDAKKTYVMIESVVYFEAYRHCLTNLQKLIPNAFPLVESILHLKSIDIRTNLEWNMSPMITTDDQSIIERYKSVDFAHWPTAELLGMDDSQYQAFRSAFQHRLALIQGPPGTGKTYVALKIIQTILHNRTYPRLMIKNMDSEPIDVKPIEVKPIEVKPIDINPIHNDPKPIVIMCYTNHALDQFLEGILPFCKNLIRIGGQSKSEKLEEYKIPRKKIKNCNSSNEEDHKKIMIAEEEMERICLMLNKIHQSITNCGQDLLDLVRLECDSEESDLELFRLFWFKKQLKSLRQKYSKDLNLALIKWITELQYDFNQRTAKFVPPRQPPKGENDIFGTTNIINEVNDIVKERLQCVPNVSDQTQFQSNNTISRSNQFHPSIRPEVITNLRNRLVTELSSNDVMSINSAKKIADISRLPYGDRWRLYRLWVKLYKDAMKDRFDNLYRKFSYNLQILKSFERSMSTYQMVISKDVIGMTITYAAKCKALIERVSPDIIVIEEAAQVLEAFVVTALPSNLKQLILIGDHKQLKPTPAVHQLAQRFKLDVSLFERLVNNGMPYKQLEIQHRMRPEISKLLVPHIYEVLNDHKIVKQYDDIKGMDKNVFFFNHSYTEESNDETMSVYNLFEAQFIVRLAKHLLFQGYKKSQITILAMYSSQLTQIRQLLSSDIIFKSKDINDSLRATSVDNYQGEENDIILVSFVRSNSNYDIGFLKVPNRVNVALSRAKKGLYCVGNFECLFLSGSVLWRDITNYLIKSGLMGGTLSLKCSEHNQIVTVMSAEDFNCFSPYGGCNADKSHSLDTGVKCPLKKCHPNDDYIAYNSIKRETDEDLRIPRPVGRDCKRRFDETRTSFQSTYNPSNPLSKRLKYY